MVIIKTKSHTGTRRRLKKRGPQITLITLIFFIICANLCNPWTFVFLSFVAKIILLFYFLTQGFESVKILF